MGAGLLLQRHVNKRGGKRAQELRRIHPQQVAAPAAVDVDARQLEDRTLQVDGHALSRAEGRRAADEIAGMARGDLRLARRDALRVRLARELLGGDLAIAVHQDHERIAVLVFHDERLHHLVLGHAERLRRVRGAAVRQVLEDVLGECHALLREERGRGRAGVFHGHIAASTPARSDAPVTTSIAPTARRICCWVSPTWMRLPSVSPSHTKGASTRAPRSVAMLSSRPATAYTSARMKAEIEISVDMVERIWCLSSRRPERYVA